MPDTFTGSPCKRVAVNLASRAALTAASRNKGWPDTASAPTTLPLSSIIILTCTEPDTCDDFALAGYSGDGRLTALPFKTPPSIALRSVCPDSVRAHPVFG